MKHKPRAKYLENLMRLSLVLIGISCLQATLQAQTVPLATNQGAPFLIGNLSEAAALHPLIATSSDERWLSGAVFIPLFVRNDSWEFKCGLCQKLPTFENELASIKSEGRRQTLKVTWEIAKDSSWGDGTPVTAKDVRLAWEMSMSYSLTSPHIIGFKAISAIDIDAKNPRKFVTTYNESRHDFMNHGILYAVPQHIEGPIWQDSAGDWTTYSAKTRYRTAPETPGLYNGSFVIKEPPKDKSLLLVRRNQTKENPSQIQSIRIRSYNNSDALINDLVAGNLSLVPEGVLDSQTLLKLQTTLKNDAAFAKRYRVIVEPGTGLEVAAFNLRNPTLIDRNIRWALAETIDRKAIASALLGFDCCTAAQLAHPKDQKLINSTETFSLGAPDFKSATTRLKSSGWTRGADGFWEKDGKKLQVKIELIKGDSLREKLVARLSSDWTKAGFQISVESIPADIFAADTLQKARFIGIASYGIRLRPGEVPQSLMHSREIPSLQNGYLGQNVMGWSSQAVDAALIAIPWEHDEESRTELIETVFKTFNNDLPIIPLFFHPVAAIAAASIPGFTVAGHDYPSSTLLSRWQLPQNKKKMAPK